MENIKKKQQKVYVLCGPAGVGKSTWAIKQMAPETDIMISRDNIRFMLLKDNEDYFAHEDKVRNIFFGAIRANTFISKDFDTVFIDATHLTPKSRRLTMNHIAPDTYKIAVSFEAPVEIAIERNANREGRALVPESVIRNMHYSFQGPRLIEGFDEIWHIDVESNITKEVRTYE